MSTKENLEYIKQELSNEEKLLESVIKAEKFYKKYRTPLKVAVIVGVLAIVGYIGYEWKVSADVRASNEAYEKLLQHPGDKEALETLKAKNERLYMLYLYHQAVAKKDLGALEKIAASNLPVLGDLAAYHLALLKKDEPKLYAYSVKEGALLKDLAVLDDGYLTMKASKIDIAHQRLDALAKESPAYPFARLLAHYGVKVQ